MRVMWDQFGKNSVQCRDFLYKSNGHCFGETFFFWPSLFTRFFSFFMILSRKCQKFIEACFYSLFSARGGRGWVPDLSFALAAMTIRIMRASVLALLLLLMQRLSCLWWWWSQPWSLPEPSSPPQPSRWSPPQRWSWHLPQQVPWWHGLRH